jgi:hypothetical protein
LQRNIRPELAQILLKSTVNPREIRQTSIPQDSVHHLF